MIITCVKEKCKHKMCMFKHPINHAHVVEQYEFPNTKWIKARKDFRWAINLNANNKRYEIWCIGLFIEV